MAASWTISKKNRETLVVSHEKKDDEDVCQIIEPLSHIFSTFDCISCTDKHNSQAADRHVPPGCQGNGVPCKHEDGAQRPGSKKLHVRVHS